MLVEVLTYLDKGLSLTGCPIDGMDKHEGGMFEILGPVSKEMAADFAVHCSRHDNKKLSPEKPHKYIHIPPHHVHRNPLSL